MGSEWVLVPISREAGYSLDSLSQIHIQILAAIWESEIKFVMDEHGCWTEWGKQEHLEGTHGYTETLCHRAALTFLERTTTTI